LQSKISNQKSAIKNQQSKISNQKSAINQISNQSNQQSVVKNTRKHNASNDSAEILDLNKPVLEKADDKS
jgi:hypothetical protein